MLKLIGILFFASVWSVTAHAQQVRNVQAQIRLGTIQVTYNLSGSEPHYKVEAYSSLDGYRNALLTVTGDIGGQVKPGSGRQINWDFRSELPADFSGELQVKVLAKRTGKISLLPIPEKIKRGEQLDIKWNGGESNTVSISLMKGNQVFQTMARKLRNSGRYVWHIPRDFKPGKDFSVRIANAQGQGRGTSSLFRVTPRISRALIFGGAALVIGGVVVGIMSGSGTDTTGGGTDTDTLPRPPTPGGG